MPYKITLVPAYGRDYTSKAKLLADWNAGKDFVIADMSSPYDGKPANKEDLTRAGYKNVNIRYKKMRQVAVIKLSSLTGLQWDILKLAKEHPKLARQLLEAGDMEMSWNPGDKVDDGTGWEPGTMEGVPDGGDEAEDTGSQVPPARDNDGHEIEASWEALGARVAGVKDAGAANGPSSAG